MDIDQMKKSWLELNERLEKSEKVNHEAIRKLLTDKVVSGYNKMRNQEKIGVYLGLLIILLFFIMYYTGRIHKLSSFIVIEVFVIICSIYSFILFRALPKYDKHNSSVVEIMKHTLRYKKLYAFVAPLLGLGIIVGLALFFFLEGKGFDSNNTHKTIFTCGVSIGVIGTIYGFRKTLAKIKEVNNDFEELRKFESEE